MQQCIFVIINIYIIELYNIFILFFAHFIKNKFIYQSKSIDIVIIMLCVLSKQYHTNHFAIQIKLFLLAINLFSFLDQKFFDKSLIFQKQHKTRIIINILLLNFKDILILILKAYSFLILSIMTLNNRPKKIIR